MITTEKIGMQKEWLKKKDKKKELVIIMSLLPPIPSAP
jgi:hypothetical protein